MPEKNWYERRLTPNSNQKRIESILSPRTKEIEFLQNLMFGKVIYLSENPSFFFRFSQYIIVQILRVKKKYEMWFWLMETGENVPAHDREIDEECKVLNLIAGILHLTC